MKHPLRKPSTLVNRLLRLAALPFFLITLAITGCGSSLPKTSANVTVCHQIGPVLNGVHGHKWDGFSSQLQSDAPPSSQLDQDVTNWLTLMQSGGWAPGSGEQTETAQAAYAVVKDCDSVGARIGGFVGGTG
jgi:hypothetical protein